MPPNWYDTVLGQCYSMIINERLALVWDSPNIACAFLVMALAWVPAFYFLVPARARNALFLSIWGCLWVLLWFLIAGTGSRGGWIAGLIILLMWSSWLKESVGCRGLLCFVVVSAIISYSLGLWSCPSSVARFSETLQGEKSASISERIKLWRASLVLIWDHPIQGFGYFGEAYGGWYRQIDGRIVGHPKPISDYLSLFLSFGTIGAGLVISFLSSVIFSSYLNSFCRRGGSVAVFAASLCLIAFFIAGVFSNIAHVWSCALIASASLMWLLFNIRLNASSIRFGISAGCICVIFTIAVAWLFSRGVNVVVVRVGETWVAECRTGGKGSVLVIGGQEDTPEELACYVGRNMIEKQWNVEILPRTIKMENGIELYGRNFDAVIIFPGRWTNEFISVMEQRGVITRETKVVVFDPALQLFKMDADRDYMVISHDALAWTRPNAKSVVSKWRRTWPRHFPGLCSAVDDWLGL